MRCWRKNKIASIGLCGLIVLSLFFGVTLLTCSTKNLLNSEKTGSIFVNSIFVDSAQADAEIIVDYVHTSKTTPDTIFDVPVGDHVVSVSKAGYLSDYDSQIVEVTENQTSTVEFTLLETSKGSLKVTSNVAGATICIDNKPTTEFTPHVFPNNVTVGTHIISIYKEEHANEKPAKEVVNIVTRDTVETHFVLTPATVGKDTGNITPDFELQDDYGIWHRYYAYRGFVTIIFFWAKSCHYCLVEMPYLEQIYKDYHSDSLIIFGINYEDDFDVISQIREEKDATFTLVKGAGTNVKKDYGVTDTPVTFILDRDGRIYFYWLGFQNPAVADMFRQKLDELFGK